MIGLALLIFGAMLLWAAFTKRGDAVVAALKMDLPNAAAFKAPTGNLGGGSGGGSASSGGSDSAPDSGSHMGLDTNGNAMVINKTYAQMTEAEKSAANNFAHHMENLGSTSNA